MLGYLLIGAGTAVVAAGAVVLQFEKDKRSPDTLPVTARSQAEPVRPAYTPPVLPPLGAAIDAKRNEVWETRDGRLVQISTPIRGDLTGTEFPRRINGDSGPTMFQFMFWRTDGVSTYGDPESDLIKLRPDVEPYFDFDEDGYAKGPADKNAREGE